MVVHTKDDLSDRGVSIFGIGQAYSFNRNVPISVEPKDLASKELGGQIDYETIPVNVL